MNFEKGDIFASILPLLSAIAFGITDAMGVCAR
jgi:hypothetical protein